MSSDEPIGAQIIDFLTRRIERRREDLRARAGNGLDDQTYQRTVGQIKECTVTLEDLAELKGRILDQLENEEEELSDVESTADRRKSRSRGLGTSGSGNTPSRRARRANSR